MNASPVRPSTVDALSGGNLLNHVRALAVEIGPRPAGSAEEARTREYIRQTLQQIGLAHGRDLPFNTPETWGYSIALAVGSALIGNLLPGKLGRLIGAGLAAGAAYSVLQYGRGGRNPWTVFAPSSASATLVVRIPPASGQAKHKVVLLGHTDTNKHRLIFAPENKRLLTTFGTVGVIAAALNSGGQLLAALGLNLGVLRGGTFLWLLSALGVAMADELGGFIDGANDNASAVACLLGLAAQLNAHPLKNTEVWLAFTGAEEVGCLGAHTLLDAYAHELTNAWFVDFEMVGTGEIVYITQHSSFTNFTSYAPDDESLTWALETARKNPELAVRGAPMTITEEVGTLRGRGYRGICIAGQGKDGWLMNWHQYSDNIAGINPQSLETAARFAWAMLQNLDNK